MTRALILPVLLAACVQTAPADPVGMTKLQFVHDGSPWMAMVAGDPGSRVDVEVTGGGGPSAPVKDYAKEVCVTAGGSFDAAAKLTYEDPGLYTILMACQL